MQRVGARRERGDRPPPAAGTHGRPACALGWPPALPSEHVEVYGPGEKPGRVIPERQLTGQQLDCRGGVVRKSDERAGPPVMMRRAPRRGPRREARRQPVHDRQCGRPCASSAPCTPLGNLSSCGYAPSHNERSSPRFLFLFWGGLPLDPQTLGRLLLFFRCSLPLDRGASDRSGGGGVAGRS